MPESCPNVVRFNAGVRPVDEDANVVVSGPGSEKRTFFLDLVGVFAGAEAAPEEMV